MEIAIAGAGIGGLTLALSLHAAGQKHVTLFEAARELRETGVGLNLPPHAVRELTELGLGDALAQAGVKTTELAYRDPAGKLIWAEPRGLDAGYLWPQYSIHRGRLHQLLVQAVQQRLGPDAIRTGMRAVSAANRAGGRIELRVRDANANLETCIEADLLVAADGIRSAVRDSLAPRPVPLASNGWVMYRGTTTAAPFLGGHTMVIIGDEHQRIVVYPIGDGILNWLLVRPRGGEEPASELGNWNLQVAPAKLAAFVQDWRYDWLDVQELVAGSAIAWEYPMTDIDPLPQWTFGRATLLGDAAHAMYPFGSNGASQAIIDARVLAYAIGTRPDVDQALQWYEQQRRPTTAEVQTANRRQAGDVMAKISQLARQAAVSDAAQELKQTESRYKQLAGFDVDTLNTRPSWSVIEGRPAAGGA
ncbi:MAG: salicylate hydroxylase [Paucimonas sp.]|nr:salicylate hydroxylase [Paucimonas sp.]